MARRLQVVACFFLGFFCTSAVAENTCLAPVDVPVVRSLADIPQDNFGRAGLSHMTVAGAVHHGMKEVEVWLQTFAPGSGTPIHRHDCEEIFLVLKGTGTLYLARLDSFEVTELPISSNSTITVPVNAVHQIRNTGSTEDLQFFVIISRPPIRVYTYQKWSTPHTDAQLQFPYPWDSQCLQE